MQGTTTKVALDDMLKQFPTFWPHLCKEAGFLHTFVSLFLGKSNIRGLQGWDTPLALEDVLNLFPSIASG